MNMDEIWVGLFSFSVLFWMLTYLFSNFAIKGFIVTRYEQDARLIDTDFFNKYAVFVRSLPPFLSAGFYATHLLMCVWGWRLYGDKKFFADIDNPDFVIQHFSKKEIRRAKFVLISGFIFFLHSIAYLIIKFAWPGSFN